LTRWKPTCSGWRTRLVELAIRHDRGCDTRTRRIAGRTSLPCACFAVSGTKTPRPTARPPLKRRAVLHGRKSSPACDEVESPKLLWALRGSRPRNRRMLEECARVQRGVVAPLALGRQPKNPSGATAS
jgi:hypothetical protein